MDSVENGNIVSKDEVAKDPDDEPVELEENPEGEKKDSRLGALDIQKQNGNKKFEKGEFDEAYKEYEKGLRFFGVMFKEGDPLRSEADLFKRDFHLNMALCSIQLRNFPQCKEHCDFVMNDLGHKNDVKALYRKGLANKEMGLFHDAERNFKRILDLDNDELYIKRTLVQMQGMRKEEKVSAKKEKEVYKKMFDQGGAMEGLYDDKEDVSLFDNIGEDDDEWYTQYLTKRNIILLSVVLLVIVVLFSAVIGYVWMKYPVREWIEDFLIRKSSKRRVPVA